MGNDARRSLFHRLAWATAVFALIVVVLGAYVRLSDAGLGCPDWPGCYGEMIVPQGEGAGRAAAAYPERPLEADKAWKEMLHRYFAGTLGLLIAALAVVAWRRRREPGQPVALPVALVAIVIAQAVLGMWTVTWLLKPAVVTAHLLGGMTTLGLLMWLVLRHGRYLAAEPGSSAARWRPWALAALVVVAVQIALGGWTSANYAALSCPDFPTCQGRWWPEMDFVEAFTLWRGLGIDYEGGVLDNAARVAIHVVHRLGAVVTLLYVGAVSLGLAWRARTSDARMMGWTVAVVLVAQVALGIANVVASLPLALAVAHNAGAALLLLAVIGLNHVVRPAGAGAYTGARSSVSTGSV